jgi:acetyl-CoA C-acetyltransferase
MGGSNVWILGGYQSDFSRNLTREGVDFAGLTSEVVTATLQAAKIDAADIGVVHVGNAFGEMFAAQGHLGAMPASVVDGLWDTPSSRHEAACASGSVAILAAIADLRSGAYETALVVGVELEKTVPGDTAAQHLGAAAWTGHEGQDATFMWPFMFSRVADEYDRRYGIDESHLRAIAQLNFANARANPNAQARDWTVPDLVAGGDDDETNPVVEGRIRRFDCSQMTDGGAGIVVVGDDYLREHPDARPIGRIEGWGHRTVGLGLQQKLDRSADDPYVMPHVRRAVLDAFERARVSLADLDGIEVHDCFTPSEYLAIDHIGLTGPGESWKAIENGEIEIGGRLPINPSGGLIGGGHPVGATGVRMLLDAAKQVSGTAGDYQVDGARTFGTLNFGGSTATTVSFVVKEA